MSYLNNERSEKQPFWRDYKKLMYIVSGVTLITIITLSVFLYITKKNHDEFKAIAEQTEADIDIRVNGALDTQKTVLKTAFEKDQAKEEANPWKTYKAEDMIGAFTFKLPKNWYPHIDKRMKSSTQWEFLAGPGYIVKDVDSDGPYVALDIKVINSKYDRALEDYKKKRFKDRSVKYQVSDEKVSGIKGSRLSWNNDKNNNKKSNFIILPYRDKVLYIGCEDYDNYKDTI